MVLLSCAVAVSAQAPAPKPKITPKKAPVAAKPAGKKAEPAAAPAPPPPPTDLQLRTKYVTGAQVSENSTFIRGSRQRFEFPGITMITQCDTKRTFQLNDGTKRYLVVTAEAAPPPAPAASGPAPGADMSSQIAAMQMGGRGAAAPKQKGGVIAETVTWTDTGDRKQLFGVEARHIKSVVTRLPGDGACETKATTVETDGWYADLPEHDACPSLSQQAPAPTPTAAGQQTCVDRVTTQTVGEARLGFALSTVVTTTVSEAKDKDKDKDQDVTSMSMEVTDLKVTILDKTLFDVPAGYTEVKDYPSLLPSLASGGSLADAVFGSLADGTSTVAPKKTGIIRVGIVTPGNKSGKEMPDIRMVGGLLDGFTKAPFEGLPVSGATAADLDRDAAGKACDYILVSDIAEIKTSKPNKVGGMLKRVSGDANAPSEIHDVRIDYKLFAVGDPAKPRIASSVKASSGGGFGVGSALRLAAFAGRMYLTMGMGGGMLGMMGPGMGGMGGLGGGMLAGRMNPGMGAAMSILSAGGDGAMGGMPGGLPGLGAGSEDKVFETVQDGLSKTAKQVAEELKKGKPAAAAPKK
ncbi:MAG: hypothetical protein ABJC89_05075 [Acidobacteriota bacterium]